MNLEIVKRVGIAAAYKGAGVLLSHFGRISEINKKEMLATNGKIHKEMLALLKIVE